MIGIMIHMKIRIMVHSKMCITMIRMTTILIIMTTKPYDHVEMISAEYKHRYEFPIPYCDSVKNR